MLELFDRSSTVLGAAADWLFAQPLPLQVATGVICLAILWVSWILLRVVLVAFRAAFRGL